MAKRKIKVTIDNRMIAAPIHEMDDIVWKDTEVGCPYCKLFAPVKAKLDIIQYGLLQSDNVHTVIECMYCGKLWAMHYLNTYEVTE